MGFSSNDCIVGLYSDPKQKNRVYDYDNKMSRSIILEEAERTVKKSGEKIKGYKGYISLDNGQSIQVFVKPKEYKTKKGDVKYIYADVSIYAPRDSVSGNSRFHSKNG